MSCCCLTVICEFQEISLSDVQGNTFWLTFHFPCSNSVFEKRVLILSLKTFLPQQICCLQSLGRFKSTPVMAKNSSYSVRRRPLFRYLSSLSWTRGLLTERTSVTTVSFLESLHSLREGSRETAPSTTKIYWSLNVHRVIHHPLSLPTQMPSLDAFLTIIFFLFPFIFTSRR